VVIHSSAINWNADIADSALWAELHAHTTAGLAPTAVAEIGHRMP
jgi:hypothetical protein